MKGDGIGTDIVAGKYKGFVREAYRSPAFMAWLADIKCLVSDAVSKASAIGRNVNVKLMFADAAFEIAAKSFGRQSLIRDWINKGRGSKARRTWLAASFLHEKGIGTPPPIGFLERWEAGRLVESYFLSEYQRDVVSFKDELIRLFREDPDCEKFISLMQCVANAVRNMHDAGFLHNDLGNQNILLKRKDAATWGDVQFIDLNRSAIKRELSLKDRARDISRIYLPSDLLRIFKEMYWGDAPPPYDFMRLESLHRRLYAVHSGTRKYRHPIRTLRNREAERRSVKYPSEKEMWIWDERSAQPISVMRPKDRARFHKTFTTLRIAETTLTGSIPVWTHYNSLLEAAYRSPVVMSKRAGIAINPKPDTLDHELNLLEQLGKIPVIIRFCRQESDKQHDFLSEVAADLHKRGHSVSIALVQDRASVREPERWDAFAARILDNVAEYVEFVEVGHAINRVKWGIWDLDEHRRLLEGLARIRAKHPHISLMGPAVIDFEYPYLIAALRNAPESLRFAALSHHLYVDRRGAPENRQGRFSALEKFALARGIARWSNACDDKLIISEVNWPLKGVGAFSPVTSPYDSPGPRFNDPSVSEEEYSEYMLRYLLIATCSGMVDRVYWWRLVARGFGLIDDTDPKNWRERPAYKTLKYFLTTLNGSTFVEKPPAKAGTQLFMFSTPDGRRICLAYSTTGKQEIAAPLECSRATTADGTVTANMPSRVHITGSPVYLFSRT